MFKKKQWLAVVRGNRWVVAQVARRKFNLNILRLSEYRPEPVVADSLESFGEKALELAEGQLEEEPLNSARNSNSLKGWLQKNHVPVNKLRLAVSCPGVITRMITLPLMSVQDLDELLTLHVDQYFTLNISDYVVDYRVLERLIEDGEMRQRVLLAALPKYQWEKLWAEWEEIGFKPDVVDLAADGLARLYSQLALRGKNQGGTDEVDSSLDMAIIELNADRVEFILLEHGMFFLYSDLEVALDGLDQITIAVTAQEGGNGGSEEQHDPELQTAKLHDWAKTEVETALGSILHSATEFFNFFAARHFGKSIDRIYITGDYADLPFLSEIFEKNLEVLTQVGFPNAWRPSYSRRIQRLQKNGMKYGSLYGLAFREG